MVALSITFTFFAEINIVLEKIKILCIHHNVEAPFLGMKFQRQCHFVSHKREHTGHKYTRDPWKDLKEGDRA